MENKISRRKFLELSAGAAALAMLPNYALGGIEMSEGKNFVIKNVKYFSSSGEVETGNIFVEGDKISKISTGEIDAKNFSTVIDGKNKFATPGFVNAHTHASMTLLRSYSDDKALMDWLQKDIWPIEDKMKSSDIKVGAELAAVEMIKSGTTSFADMYGPNMEEVAKVVETSGLRGILCRGIIGLFNGEEKLATNVDLYKNWHGKADGRITVMFGPHAIYTCPPDFLKKIYNEASKLDAEIHMKLKTKLTTALKNMASDRLKLSRRQDFLNWELWRRTAFGFRTKKLKLSRTKKFASLTIPAAT